MSTGSGWETVGRKGKSSNKLQKKDQYTNNLNVDQGIKASDTIFQVFLEEERKREERKKSNQALKDQSSKDVKNSSNKENATKPKKKKPTTAGQTGQTDTSKKDSKPKTLEAAAKQLKKSDLTDLFELSKEHFPDAPIIWLKDLASFINDKLSYTIDDPLFANKTPDYPTSLLGSDVRKEISNLFHDCTEPTLKLFQEFCLQSLINNMVKSNLPTLGYRLMIQFIAFEYPNLTVKNLHKFSELRSAHQNHTQVSLSILWCASQAGVKDIKSGLKIWLALMLPLLGVKSLTKFVIENLEKLLKIHPNIKSIDDVLSVNQFIQILDLSFTTNGLPASSQKQLLALYSKLKGLAFKSNKDKKLPALFPLFLQRLNSTSSQNLRNELLSDLTDCLSLDSQCFSIWRQIYTQYLTESAILLEYINNNWDKLPTKFPKKVFRETLHTMKVTNEDLRDEDGLKDCRKQCNDLLTKMNKQSFPWRVLLLLVLAIVGGIVTYDIQHHGSFQKSNTLSFLIQSGILEFSQHCWTKSSFYLNKGTVWLRENAPVYIKMVNAQCGPYVNMIWNNLRAFGEYSWKSTEALRIWANIYIQPLMETVINDYVPKILIIMDQLYAHLQEHFVFIQKMIAKISERF